MSSTLTKAIGAVKDQTSISFAKVASSTKLEVAILKATTHDNVPADERYIYEVVQLVVSHKIYAKSCARAIGRRIGRTRNWIVALKSLMLVLRIFQDGDPYFPREVLHAMKRGAKILNLYNFLDDSNSRPWDYTAFVRAFALYLDERMDCFLSGKLHRQYTIKERGRSGRRGYQRHKEVIHDMKPPVLLDKITFWQRLLDRAIGTRPTGAASTNRLVLISLYAVLQESFDLYKDISERLALLIDGFFHLQYHLCVGAFEACVKASKQNEELRRYYSYCLSLGVGRSSEYPSIQTISEELIETLQEYLKDQSSFPAVTKSSHRLALPPPPPSNSSHRRIFDSYDGHSRHRSYDSYDGHSRHRSYDSYDGQSEFAEFSKRRFSRGYSKSRSRCTLEELLNATDVATRQGTSIDLEAYHIDQFDNHTQQNQTLRPSDAGSTQSLPTLNAMPDLLCLDDWPDEAQEAPPEQQQSQSNIATGWDWELVLSEAIQSPSTQTEPNKLDTFNAFPGQEGRGQETSSGDNWELVLEESKGQPVQLEPNKSGTFDPFSGPEHLNGQEMSSGQGWELVLADTATHTPQQQPDFISSVYNLYNQPATSSTSTYNPFLEEPGELAIVPVSSSPGNLEPGFQSNDAFSAVPTFQATATYGAPTFQAATSTYSTQNSNENDPFSDQMFNGSISQPNLLNEQQLWF
ncbi:clathrin coat assembly protein AP180-like [Heracleum sosnowskyi]|uniref:Clathrin coat assembly protein AP180-like n=1 Tax=Heracleum sosnowskyi TaxID=360622 RepID=A0AAD8J2Z8_9APIA|nr:clathrin coat assembly protein AP180-like [Heracleum sosnowskyi]